MKDFHSLYSHDFVRVAACVPEGHVADPMAAAAETLRLAREGHAAGTALMLFPELGISSYAIDDLLFQDALADAVEAAIAEIVAQSRALAPVLVIGAPLRHEGRLYNCGVAIHRGSVLGVVPKAYPPNYREFYERRHFTPGIGIVGQTIAVAGQEVPFGMDLLFRSTGAVPFTFHIEICEDIWVPLPPSAAEYSAAAVGSSATPSP